MTPSQIRIALIVLVTLLVGFGLGVFVNGPTTELPKQTAKGVTSEATDPVSSTEGEAAEPVRGVPLPAAAPKVEAVAAERFWTTLTIEDERERLAAWNALLPGMTSDNALEIRGLFLKMDQQGRWFVPEWDAFWPRWGEVDGPGALANVDATVGWESYRPTLAEKILRGWTKADSRGARAWLEANSASPLYVGALRGYLDTLARSQLDGATQEAVTLGKGRSLGGAWEVLADRAVQQRQLGGMLEWWRSLPDDPTAGSARHEALWPVYQRLQRGDDARTEEWLSSLAATPYRSDSCMTEFAKKVAGSNPAAAVEWVASVPPSPADGRYSGIDFAVGALAQRDARAVETWLGGLSPSALRDQAVAAYASHLAARGEAEVAAQWRVQVQDQKWIRSAEVSVQFGR